MPQKTNLNISPENEDLNKEDKFYKVLFKPGFPVQAREVNDSTVSVTKSNRIFW